MRGDEEATAAADERDEYTRRTVEGGGVLRVVVRLRAGAARRDRQVGLAVYLYHVELRRRVGDQIDAEQVVAAAAAEAVGGAAVQPRVYRSKPASTVRKRRPTVSRIAVSSSAGDSDAVA